MKRPPAKTFRDLIAWQKAHDFVLGIYPLTARFPSEELYGLSCQFRRAAVSVAANIAEGFPGRLTERNFDFTTLPRDHWKNADITMILSKDLGYHSDPSKLTLAEEVSKLLKAMMNSIERGSSGA